MDTDKLEHIARTLVALGKGLLGADESNVSCEERFDAVGVHNNEETRREYRELLITAPDAEKSMSGIILSEETLFQATQQGQLFREYLKNHHVLPGIRADKGPIDLAGFPNEKVTQGLDALPYRMHAFSAAGAFFAKWRAVIVVSDDGSTPTDEAIGANTLALARYARICQEAGVVPIVEVDVLSDGSYSIDRCEEVMSHVLDILFPTMRAFRVHLPGAVLKTGIVQSGTNSGADHDADDIADRTCRVLHEHVPHELGGVLLADNGESFDAAVAALNKIAQRGPHPWGVTFSYGQALQDSVLTAWAENRRQPDGAAALYTKRLAQAAAASQGQLDHTTPGDEDFSPYGHN